MNETSERQNPEETPQPVSRRGILGWIHPKETPARPKTVQVIANPASGQGAPILKILANVFNQAGIEWDIAITKASGDGKRLAEEAINAGADVVVAYGGDGTVVDVASGLIDRDTPLGILPGGTANMMSRALGIPQDLGAAAQLIASHPLYLHRMYIGQAGKYYFAQMVSVGTGAKVVEGADRSAKNRLGGLAYMVSAFKAITDPTQAHYMIELDGLQTIEENGVSCLVAKTGNLGIAPLEQSPDTANPDAPLMDIVVVRKADIPSILNLAATVATGGINTNFLPHWQASRVRVITDHPEIVQADGEVIGKTPIDVHLVPQAINVIVSADTLAKHEKANSPGE